MAGEEEVGHYVHFRKDLNDDHPVEQTFVSHLAYDASFEMHLRGAEQRGRSAYADKDNPPPLEFDAPTYDYVPHRRVAVLQLGRALRRRGRVRLRGAAGRDGQRRALLPGAPVSDEVSEATDAVMAALAELPTVLPLENVRDLLVSVVKLNGRASRRVVLADHRAQEIVDDVLDELRAVGAVGIAIRSEVP